MLRPIIHFAHANGFPAQTYNKLFSYLRDEYEIGYLERHAHNPKFPVTDNWFRLKDELIEELKTRYSRKIIGVGHSLGGILHLLAAAENPELYERIILLDAPIIGRLSSFGLRFAKSVNLIDRFSPSRVTRFRRRLWHSKADAFAHFKAKSAFDKFDEDVLRDYVEYGTTATENGFELIFDPLIEAKIYRTIPHHLPKLRGRLPVPVAFIGGRSSREAKLAGTSFMRKHLSVDFHLLDGTHLFPLEYPRQTAEKIREIING